MLFVESLVNIKEHHFRFVRRFNELDTSTLEIEKRKLVDCHQPMICGENGEVQVQEPCENDAESEDKNFMDQEFENIGEIDMHLKLQVYSELLVSEVNQELDRLLSLPNFEEEIDLSRTTMSDLDGALAAQKQRIADTDSSEFAGFRKLFKHYLEENK